MRPPIPFRARGEQSEWLTGRYKLPKTFDDDGKAIRPEVILWLELPSGVIVNSTISTPRDRVLLAQSFEETVERPAHGSPRRPAQIRVATPALAKELSECGVPVTVAPVPELDGAFADLSAALSEHIDGSPEDFSYFGDGSIPQAMVATLFSTAGVLFRAAPWRHVAEYQVLRVDIPALGVEGACLSVIGGGDESYGLLLFRSFEVYRAFTTQAQDPERRQGSGESVFLSFSFDRKKNLPPRMLDEVAQYRWPVAGARAYPVVFAIDDGMNPIAATERDYAITIATTLAFLSFLAEHGDVFELDEPDTVCASYGGDGATVTLTAPFGEPLIDESMFDEPLFDVNDYFDQPISAPLPRNRAGRNDPCPCGSGKKYKKCHLGSNEPLPDAAEEQSAVHPMDRRLVGEIGRFAFERFGSDWCGAEIEADESLLPLYLPWIVWSSAVAGTRVADSYFDENEARLSARERDWFAAQKRAWLGVWEVTRVEPGVIEVRDLLTGERRSVSESLGSQVLVPREVLLARVIDFDGQSYFGGLYARALLPSDAGEVARAIRTKLRIRDGAIAAGRLRDAVIGRFLIEQWMGAVRDFDERHSRPPELRNTDGDPLMFVRESFRFKPKARPEIVKRLAAMEGADEAPGEAGQTEFVFLNDADTVVGRVLVGTDTLVIETNSEPRADSLGRRVRDACPGQLRRNGRTWESPDLSHAKDEPPPELSIDEQRFAREYKERHYREWLSIPLPALGGKTPRAAARSPKSRERLDLLLRDMESFENRLPAEERFDFGQIRRELGLA